MTAYNSRIKLKSLKVYPRYRPICYIFVIKPPVDNKMYCHAPNNRTPGIMPMQE